MSSQKLEFFGVLNTNIRAGGSTQSPSHLSLKCKYWNFYAPEVGLTSGLE